MKRIFAKLNLLRIGLLLAATVIVLLIVPRADRQSYSYELNQPWKYPLLMAEFDTPILRDSTSIRQMRDSIEANFIPFALREQEETDERIERFSTSVRSDLSAPEATLLTRLVSETCAEGISSPELYRQITRGNNTKYRIMTQKAGETPVLNTFEGTHMRTQKQAFDHVDSLYAAATGQTDRELPAGVARALGSVLVPNLLVDSINDIKYRNQEYLNVNGALGVIKKGQRIVDRGEIITQQIFTNLNTYQEMLQSKNSDNEAHSYFYIGQALYILCCWLVLFLFLAIYRPRFYADIRQMSFLVALITLFVVISTLVFEFNMQAIYVMPFSIIPVTVMVFFDSRTAIFSLLTTVLLTAIIATYQFQFIVLELITGLIATFTINHLSKRSQLLRTAGVTLLVYSTVYFALVLATDGDLSYFNPGMLLMFVFNSLILSFAYVLILIIEKIFGFTSMVTMVELSDINHPLLRRLAEEAPGTFQHSMQVSTLAAEAARAIGANTQLVRTGALYHDIGKMESPIFFTENQHGVNPHAGLNPETSARKIISHVTDGLALASKYKLPQVIKNFISQHHGKGLTKYFYNTAVNEKGVGEVNQHDFEYPGPNPQSKETAILMMADAVEAASRSLKDYSQDSIDNLVDRLIDTQIADGLLRESPLSFKDVDTIKRTFKKRLATIYHTRVAYPAIKKK
ncbi:MAG: HDIG domain-containing protein [Muribaculaceae bacterium]|nr:HDIG domain-containing protein [Muribaculaceae bacterium]